MSRRQFGLTDLIRLVADVATIWYLSSRLVVSTRTELRRRVIVSASSSSSSSFAERIESSRRSQLVNDPGLLINLNVFDAYELLISNIRNVAKGIASLRYDYDL